MNRDEIERKFEKYNENQSANELKISKLQD